MKWYKRYQHQQLYITLVKYSVEGMVQRKEHYVHVALEIKEPELAELNRLLKKFYPDVKDKLI